MYRIIKADITVSADISRVYQAFTTTGGIQSFFAPECGIDPRPGGLFELYFDLDAPKGSRGSEGVRYLALQENAMVSFSWNNPPHLKNVRKQKTSVTLYFSKKDNAHTHVKLYHSGWGTGSEWDSAYTYFDRVWKDVVLFRLHYRFQHGPVDWNNLPG